MENVWPIGLVITGITVITTITYSQYNPDDVSKINTWRQPHVDAVTKKNTYINQNCDHYRDWFHTFINYLHTPEAHFELSMSVLNILLDF